MKIEEIYRGVVSLIYNYRCPPSNGSKADLVIANNVFKNFSWLPFSLPLLSEDGGESWYEVSVRGVPVEVWQFCRHQQQQWDVADGQALIFSHCVIAFLISSETFVLADPTFPDSSFVTFRRLTISENPVSQSNWKRTAFPINDILSVNCYLNIRWMAEVREADPARSVEPDPVRPSSLLQSCAIPIQHPTASSFGSQYSLNNVTSHQQIVGSFGSVPRTGTSPASVSALRVSLSPAPPVVSSSSFHGVCARPELAYQYRGPTFPKCKHLSRSLQPLPECENFQETTEPDDEMFAVFASLSQKRK